MLFHDNGFVLLRLACGFKLSVSRCYGWLESVNFPVNHNIAIRAVYTHFHCFSSLARLVMNFGRHLATSYLIFHGTSITKGRLLTLLTILIIVILILSHLCLNDFFISYEVGLLIIVYYSLSPNGVHQLQVVHNCQEKSQKQRNISGDEKSFIWKLYRVACQQLLVLWCMLSIPVFISSLDKNWAERERTFFE
jgi:hypothetical protein